MSRDAFKASFVKASFDEQVKLVQTFMQEAVSFRDIHFLDQLIQQAGESSPRQVRLALLSDYTIDSLAPILRVQLFRLGLSVKIYIPGYNQIEQEIRNPESSYLKFKSDITLISFSDGIADAAGFAGNVSKRSAELDALLEQIQASTTSRIIVNTIPPPFQLSRGMADHGDSDGQLSYVRKLNQHLVDSCADRESAYIFDLASLISRVGEASAYSLKMWFSSKMPFTLDFQQSLGKAWANLLASFYITRKKCLVLDLDNTLWGGVVGEEGLDQIKIGEDYPGEVYTLIQRRIKAYADQGIILALNSKNNLRDAQEVFEKKSGMALSWDDFSAVRVNWQTKTVNLEELSKELNIGLESMVFVDDNPAEIAAVNQFLPMVDTISFNGSPIENLRRISELDSFLNLNLTREDLQKTEQYRVQQKRTALQQESGSLEDFYRRLEMVARIELGRMEDIQRLTQLTQKTNQFNLTSRRYDEVQMRTFLTSPDWMIIQMRLEDRFGDNGITGLVMAELTGKTLRIDNFLMSCRIIGRTAETALMAFCLGQAQAAGFTMVRGEYIPSPKNAPVADFYAKHGFKQVGSFWERSTRTSMTSPEWIKVDHG